MKRLGVIISITLLTAPLSGAMAVTTGTTAYARVHCGIPPASAYTKKGQCLKNNGAVWVPDARRPGSCRFWTSDAAVLKKCGF